MLLSGMVSQADRGNSQLPQLVTNQRSPLQQKSDRLIFGALDFEMNEDLCFFVNSFERLPICFLGHSWCCRARPPNF